jgi:hypothetical protein
VERVGKEVGTLFLKAELEQTVSTRIADGLDLNARQEMTEDPGSKMASMVQGFFAKRTELFLNRYGAC